MRLRKGYTLIELLIALMFFTYIVSQLLIIQSYLMNYDYKIEERQNRIGLVMLRRYFSLGNQHVISQNQIEMLYKNEQFLIEIQDNGIILSPGFVEFILDFETASFVQKDARVYLLLDDDLVFIGYQTC